MKSERWTIGEIFVCDTCGKRWEDYRTAQNQARKHAQNQGHSVSGEVTKAVQYSPSQPTEKG